MVVSLNKGTPIETPKYYSSYYWDPKMVPLILGNPHMWMLQDTWNPERGPKRELCDSNPLVYVSVSLGMRIFQKKVLLTLRVQGSN